MIFQPMRWLRRRARNPRPTTVVSVVLIGAMATLVGGGLSRLHVDTGVDSFIPGHDRSTQAFKDVSASFGGDPIVVLVESKAPGGSLSDQQLPHLLDLEGKLSRLPDVASVYGPASVLNQIAGQTQKLLAELTGYRDGLQSKAENDARAAGASPEEIRQAVARATADFDGRYGSLIAQGLPSGLPTLHNDRFVHTVVFDPAGQARPQWHSVVPTPNSVAILVRPRQNLDQSANEQLVSAIRQAVGGAGLDTQRVTISGGPTVVAALGAEVRREGPLLGAVALIGVGAWFVLMRWTGWRRRLIPVLTTMTATATTLALFGWLDRPVSLGEVAFLPILLGVGSDFMTYLHRRVTRRVVVSVALATAASFAALAATPIPVVRDLGITLALGMIVALSVALLVDWRFPPTAETADRRRPRTESTALGRFLVGNPAVVAQHTASRRTRTVAGVLVGVLAIAGWMLLPTLPLKADFQSFAGDLPVLTDARHVEDVMGSSGEVDVVLSGPNTVSRQSLDWMRQAQDAIISSHGDQMRPMLSPPTLLQFLGPSPTSEQVGAALRLLPTYLTGSVIRDDKQMSVLSFGVRLGDAQQMEQLRDDLVRVLPPPPPGVSVRLTGLPIVAVSAYEAVSSGRYLASALGIMSAGLILTLGLRRRTDAVCAVIAAGMASGLGLFGMWLTGTALNPITVALGSLTAAVGCEFTVVLAEARRRQDPGIQRAVLLAGAASATGYSVLVLSGLSLVRQFGALLAATVVLALLSAAFVVWLMPLQERRRDTCEHSRTQSNDDLVGVL